MSAEPSSISSFDMRSFLLKFGWFLALQALVLAGVYRGNRAVIERNYFAAFGDKQARLESTPAPRLILAGGSGMAFGLDSGRLEAELGRPVVNMGLHVALGVEFQLNALRPYLREGDVVLLGFEYESLDGFVRTYEALQVAAAVPRALGFLSGSQLRQISDELHLFLGGWVRNVVEKRKVDPVWSRKAFTDRGDLRARFRKGSLVKSPARASGKGRTRFMEENSPLPMPSPKRLARHLRALRKFTAFAARAGVEVFYSYPPHPGPRLANSAAA